jgi:hypothetical protein
MKNIENKQLKVADKQLKIALRRGSIEASCVMFDQAAWNQDTKQQRHIAKGKSLGIYETANKPKVYTREDASRRNNRIAKTIVTETKFYSGFLTLVIPVGSEHNTPEAFSKALQKLSNALEYQYPGSFWDYWIELSNNGILHVHSLFWINGPVSLFSIKDFIYSKWSKIINCPNKVIVDVRSFHRKQLGYASKKAKRERTLKLLQLMKGKKSFGTIMSKNKTVAKARIFNVKQDQASAIQLFLIARMRQKARLHSYHVNSHQIFRIESGWFAHHYMDHQEADTVELLCLYDECQIYYKDYGFMAFPLDNHEDDIPFASDALELAYDKWEEHHLAA